jgi:hypothetical protein
MSSTIVGGYQGRLTFSMESVYGLVPSGVQYNWIGLIADAEPDINVGNINIRKIGIRDLAAIVKGRREAQVKFTYYMQPGGGTVTAGSSFLKANNILGVSTGTWPNSSDTGMTGSFTAELFYQRQSPNTNLLFYVPGCKIEETQIDQRVGEPTKITITSYGQQLYTGSVQSGSSYQADPATNPFMWYDGTVQYTPNGGTTRVINNVTETRTRIRQQLERVYNVQNNTVTIRVLQERGRDIEGDMTVNFETFDEATELLSDTDFRLDFAWGTSQGVTGSFYNCKWMNTSWPTKPTDLLTYKLPFTARSGSIS